MSYTERFTEAWELLGYIDPASHSAEQNTGRMDCSGFDRVAVHIYSGVTDGTIDIDVEEADAASGGTLQSFDGGNKDVTFLAVDHFRVIEIKAEEFDVNDKFRWLNIEATPSQAKIFGISVWGLAKSKPADTTNIDGITD